MNSLHHASIFRRIHKRKFLVRIHWIRSNNLPKNISYKLIWILLTYFPVGQRWLSSLFKDKNGAQNPYQIQKKFDLNSYFRILWDKHFDGFLKKQIFQCENEAKCAFIRKVNQNSPHRKIFRSNHQHNVDFVHCHKKNYVVDNGNLLLRV